MQSFSLYQTTLHRSNIGWEDEIRWWFIKGWLASDIDCYKLLINTEIFWHKFNIISGEPFNDEEIEEMMSVALDDKGNVVYKEYIPLMTVDENFTAWYSKRLNTRIWCY